MPYHLVHRMLLPALAGTMMAGAAQAADGLQPPAASTWPAWQARLHLGFDQPAGGGNASLRQAALLGDYYLQRHGDGGPSTRWRGGFRATSGLVVGHIGGLPSLSADGRNWSTSLLTATGEPRDSALEAWPYIGFGYSGLAPRGGWGFSADLGIALRQPAAAPDLARALLDLRGWESTLRRLEPLPMLQLGVHYRF